LSVLNYSASAFYARTRNIESPRKRGVKPVISDADLLPRIKAQIAVLPFHSVGYKKLHMYWRKANPSSPPASKERFRRVMAGSNLLLKKPGGTGSSYPHNGVIKTKAPNVMWATDGKKFFTEKEGWCNFTGVIDHFNSEIIGWSIAETADRFEAFIPVGDAIIAQFGGLTAEAAKGVSLRVDCGSAYTSKYFRKTALFYGIDISYTRARSPESNGVIERFHRTLEEQVFSVHQFKSLAQARIVIAQFVKNYNKLWIFHESKGLSPIEMREAFNKIPLLNCA
jgi:transposase InsO family protein